MQMGWVSRRVRITEMISSLMIDNVSVGLVLLVPFLCLYITFYNLPRVGLSFEWQVSRNTDSLISSIATQWINESSITCWIRAQPDLHFSRGEGRLAWQGYFQKYFKLFTMTSPDVSPFFSRHKAVFSTCVGLIKPPTCQLVLLDCKLGCDMVLIHAHVRDFRILLSKFFYVKRDDQKLVTNSAADMVRKGVYGRSTYFLSDTVA